VPVDVHVTVTVDQGGPLVPADPDPGPRWWQRLRIGCAIAGFLLCGPWAWVLKDIRDDGTNGLAGAWVMALFAFTVLGFWDNASRIAARHADPELWGPRIRATVARTLLWAALWATALTLPITTLVLFTTGVHT